MGDPEHGLSERECMLGSDEGLGIPTYVFETGRLVEICLRLHESSIEPLMADAPSCRTATAKQDTWQPSKNLTQLFSLSSATPPARWGLAAWAGAGHR